MDGKVVTKRWVSSRLTGEPAAPADFIIQRPPFQRGCCRRRRRVQSGDHGAHRNEQPPKSYHGRRSKDQRIPTCGYQSYFAWRKIICVHFSLLQGLARMQALGLVKFAPAVAYHFGLAFPAAYLQPGARLLAEPCIVNYNSCKNFDVESSC